MTSVWRTRTSGLAAVLLAVVAALGTSAAPAEAADVGSGYAPATSPARLLDTRSGLGATAGQIPAGRTLTLQVTGRGGVPSTGVAAVALNVTVTGPAAAGFVSVYPGPTRPVASTVNYVAGQTIPNQTIVKVSSTGRVTVYAHSRTHVVVDVLGWFPTGSDLKSLSPVRAMDTRSGLGAPLAQVTGGRSVDLQVTGRTGVPAAGVGAVLLNVTVTRPRASGFVTVYPTGGPTPTASNVNVSTGQTISGFVIAKVGAGGKVSLYTRSTADLVVDVSGYFLTGSTYSPLTPARALDTRTGVGAPVGKVGGGATVTIQVGGMPGVPADADAAFVNVTAVDATGPGVATAYPSGRARPGTSTVNFANGLPVSNSALADLGTDGTLTIHTTSASHLIVDVFGWVPDTNPPAAVSGLDILDRTDTSVTLAWQNPLDIDLAEVVVRRAEGTTPPATVTEGSGVPLATPTATSVTDPTLVTATAYAYSVFTVDSSGHTRHLAQSVVANPATGQLSVQDVGEQASWSANFGPPAAGRTVTFQVRSIVTTMTDEVAQSSWRAIGSAVADGSGVASLLESDPLEVTHSYRAIVGSGSSLTLTGLVSHAAQRGTKNTGLATLYLDTNEASPILTRTDYLEGRLTMVPGSATTGCGTTTVTQSLLKTRGRGNSTWTFPKKPYNFNLDKKADLCGLGSSKKWALLANHYDKSLLRTGVAMDIGRGLTNLAWTPKQEPVDFYLNGVYQGSYSLIERVGVATNRVNIDPLEDNLGGVNDSAPAVTGGYLLEWDFRASADHNVQVGPGGIRGWVGIKEPEDEDDGSGITQAQVAFIDGHLDTVDAALFSPAFTHPVNGWRKYIDEASAVDYYIAQEVTKPVDGAFGASVYMHKARDADPAPGDQGKLFMGPMWDYDMGMGNSIVLGDKARTDTWLLRDPLGPNTGQTEVNWYNRLMQDPAFVAAVEARWAEVRPALETTVDSYLPAQAHLIEQSAQVNFTRWSVTEKTSSSQVINGGWHNEVDFLGDWLTARISWMDGELTP
jgi:hypothetical protein